MTAPASQRAETGIPGLDTVLEGGLIRGSVYLIRGAPGSGKTILANQIGFHTAALGGRATYVTLLAEANDQMIAHLSRLRFFRPELVGSKVSYLSLFKILEERGLAGLLQTMREIGATRGAQLIVVDGLVAAEDFAKSPQQFKAFVHDLHMVATMSGATVLLLTTQRSLNLDTEQTVVDGVIDLTEDMYEMRALRYLRVRKMRGTNALRGKHLLSITDEGIVVRPRIEKQCERDQREVLAPDPHRRKRFGIPQLDRMLGGGPPELSTTMIAGPTGSGKTILGLHYLLEGARGGERGLFIGFHETPPELLAKSDRLGLGLRGAVNEGAIHLMWQRPVEGLLDLVAEQLLALVHAHHITRVCVDGVHTFSRTIDYPERLPEAVAAIKQQLLREGVTLVYTYETPQVHGQLQLPPQDLPASAHNIIVQRHCEVRARTHHVISVLKMRDSGHDPRAYEFRIDEGGLHVDNTYDSAAELLGPAGHDGAARKTRR
ncbi:MAG: hypothetical protein KF773_37830 [Deltaproteobacteria bacterium]|nr:hypothetical protein [Deltaproteobacteria bacterium]